MSERTYKDNGTNQHVVERHPVPPHVDDSSRSSSGDDLDTAALQALLQDLYQQGTAATVKLGMLNPWDYWDEVADLDNGILGTESAVSARDEVRDTLDPERERDDTSGWAATDAGRSTPVVGEPVRSADGRVAGPVLADTHTGQSLESGAAQGPMRPKRRRRLTNEQIFAALGELLVKGDENIQMQVLDALKQVGKNAPTSLVKATCEMTTHPQESIRRRAVLALGETKEVELALPVLIAAVGDSRYNVRRNAAVALGRLGDAGAVDALIPALQDTNHDVRRRVVETLGKLGDPRALDPIAVALKDDDEFVRKAAAEALGQLNDERAVGPLTAALQDYYRIVRQEAATALGELGGGRSLVALINALKDRDKGVRRSAVEALDNIGDRRAVVPLITALSDSDVGVRKRVVDALGRMGDPRAAEPLFTVLTDSDAYVRHKASEALESLRSNPDVRPIAPAIEENAPITSGEATERPSIGDGHGPSVETGKQPENRQIAFGSVTTLQHKPVAVDTPGVDSATRPMTVPSTEGTIEEEAPDQVEFPTQDVTALVAALRDGDPDVRVRAAEALGQLNDPRAIKPLIRRFSDSDLAVRQAATQALENLGEPAVAPLVAALIKCDGAVQRQAAHVLADRADPRTVRPFVRALQTGDGIVQWEAIRALKQIGTPQALAAVKRHEEGLQKQARSRQLYTRLIWAGFALAVGAVALVWAMGQFLG